MAIPEQDKEDIFNVVRTSMTHFLAGEFEQWRAYVTEDIRIVGTVEHEWFCGIQSAMSYFSNHGPQSVGTLQFKKADFDFLAVGELVMVTTSADCHILMEDKWLQDPQWRISHLYTKADGTWKCCYMHTSIPDLRISDGESAPFTDLINQNKRLEEEVQKQTKHLEDALTQLKSTQKQLIHSEKMASLGELTAGIAHEIKNPLNFVNNFSGVSMELMEEVFQELEKVNQPDQLEEVNDLLEDININLTKIHEHGSRADSIVKSMLLHSRGGSGKPEPQKINEIIKEYVNLAFHGMRAGKRPFNVKITLNLDEQIDLVPIIAEDFSRVIVNLCNNAFDAMRDKLTAIGENQEVAYNPHLTVLSKAEDGNIIIEVQDNGAGVPEEFVDKILQPFFTTKKGTLGTGLGLSISFEIIKAHGGTISVLNHSDRDGACFKIELPNAVQS